MVLQSDPRKTSSSVLPQPVPDSNSISVVIPVYNSAGILPGLVERLAATSLITSPGFELILVTEDLSDRLVRLPLFYSLTDEMLGRVVQAILSFG